MGTFGDANENAGIFTGLVKISLIQLSPSVTAMARSNSHILRFYNEKVKILLSDKAGKAFTPT
jgi:hypothetical protein